MSVRVSRARAVVATGRRPTVVARVAGISRQAIYRPISRRPLSAGPGRTRPDDARIVETAINGALAALDPHSAYMNPAAFREMMTASRGTFGGVGMEVTMENDLVKVVSPIEGTVTDINEAAIKDPEIARQDP